MGMIKRIVVSVVVTVASTVILNEVEHRINRQRVRRETERVYRRR